MGIILEITCLRIQTVFVEPIVGDADVQTTKGVCQRQVELLRIILVCQAHTAPRRQRQSFVGYAQRRLQRHIA